MKYNVKLKVIDMGSICVDANSIEEAKEKAEQAYYSGSIFWDESEISEMEVIRTIEKKTIFNNREDR